MARTRAELNGHFFRFYIFSYFYSVFGFCSPFRLERLSSAAHLIFWSIVFYVRPTQKNWFRFLQSAFLQIGIFECTPMSWQVMCVCFPFCSNIQDFCFTKMMFSHCFDVDPWHSFEKRPISFIMPLKKFPLIAWKNEWLFSEWLETAQKLWVAKTYEPIQHSDQLVQQIFPITLKLFLDERKKSNFSWKPTNVA